MTREEARFILQDSLQMLQFEFLYFGLKEAIEVAIEVLSKPSLPSDLDEAADAHIRRVADAGWEWTTQDIAEAFKAGAEWRGCKTSATRIASVRE